jgi:hypothetical protein
MLAQVIHQRIRIDEDRCVGRTGIHLNGGSPKS